MEKTMVANVTNDLRCFWKLTQVSMLPTQVSMVALISDYITLNTLYRYKVF